VHQARELLEVNALVFAVVVQERLRREMPPSAIPSTRSARACIGRSPMRVARPNCTNQHGPSETGADPHGAACSRNISYVNK
jgi:hypothetical protein